MSNFKALLKKSSNLEKFNTAIKEDSKFKSEEGYWQPTVDEAGNGYAVIRFLSTPKIDGEDGLPWVKYFEHGFQGPGGWYIELSRTTLGLDDPVSEYNTKLWNTGIKSNQEIASKQKRKLRYVSNVKIINDPKHPEYNGKTFKYRYGPKIFEKIKAKMSPEFEGETPIDVFDFFEGANFKLKIRTVQKQRNYDLSEFDAVSALDGGDEKVLEELWNSLPSLKELIAPEKFKDYATLKQRLDKVLGFDTGAATLGTSAGTNTDVGTRVEAQPKTARTAESVELGDTDDPALFDTLAE